MVIGIKPTIRPERRERPNPEYSLADGQLQVEYGNDSNIGHRINPTSMERMKEIDGMTDIQAALEAIVDLYQNGIRWESVDKSIYSKGRLVTLPEPSTVRWKRCKPKDVMFPGSFSQEVYVGGKNISESLTFSEPNLDGTIIKAIQAQPIVIGTKTGKYVFIYDEREHDPTYIVTGHIVFRNIREVK